jgi:hypothetical protein
LNQLFDEEAPISNIGKYLEAPKYYRKKNEYQYGCQIKKKKERSMKETDISVDSAELPLYEKRYVSTS